jgi:hypothetical protein
VEGLLQDFVDGVYRPYLIDFSTFSSADSSKLESLKEVSRNLLTKLEGQEDQLVVIYDKEFASLPTLAGLLLSYPALYYSEGSSALTDADVDVYSLYTDSPNRQKILQFSAPLAFRQEITHILDLLVEEWTRRISRLAPMLAQKWKEYTGVESCTLKTQVEIRRVSILTL